MSRKRKKQNAREIAIIDNVVVYKVMSVIVRLMRGGLSE